MITKQQAIEANELHFSQWHNSKGDCQVLRRNGKTQTWITRPDEFRFPGKWGLRNYFQVTQENAHLYHLPADCPVEAKKKVLYEIHDNWFTALNEGMPGDVSFNSPSRGFVRANMVVNGKPKSYKVIVEEC